MRAPPAAGPARPAALAATNQNQNDGSRMSRVDPLRQPLQARSVASYGRLIAAAREILAEKSFDDATVAEIAERAGLTVGAFYARFTDKEALLRHLEELLFDAMRSVVEHIATRAEGRAPASLVRDLSTALVRIYRRQRAVARALVLRSHSDPALAERLRALNRENMRKVIAALLASGQIRHAVPERAVWFALHAQRALLRDAILFGDGWAGDRRPSDARLVDESTRLVAAYLGFAEGA